ncbi:hypothetical protein X801_05591 [Opisthorchis viverrini]|uniref:Uncharacterized protein n=1 Tax=Opisthorchis viverrini TaxID=6198 RepID=A0A1S8WVV2_OPIVI|nr:hypothetical protein X801_05591 [Opisthorchis viverrini]
MNNLVDSFSYPPVSDIVSGSDAAYNAEDSGRFKTILVFECRGVELIAFSPRAGWSADGLDSGTSFVDISLSDEVCYVFDLVPNWCTPSLFLFRWMCNSYVFVVNERCKPSTSSQ